MDLVRKLFTEETGQGLAEYAFILMLVALVVVAGLRALPDGIISSYDRTTNCLK